MMSPKILAKRERRTRWADVAAIAGGIVLAYLIGLATGLGIWPF